MQWQCVGYVHVRVHVHVHVHVVAILSSRMKMCMKCVIVCVHMFTDHAYSASKKSYEREQRARRHAEEERDQARQAHMPCEPIILELRCGAN